MKQLPVASCLSPVDLQQFCAGEDDPREELRRPFAAGGRIWALGRGVLASIPEGHGYTDSHGLARTDTDSREDHLYARAAMFALHWAFSFATETWKFWPEHDKAIWTRECDQCAQVRNNVVSPLMHHDPYCPACGGTGWIVEAGDQVIDGGSLIDGRIHQAIASLPGARYSPPRRRWTPVAIKFDGDGLGLVLPMIGFPRRDDFAGRKAGEEIGSALRRWAHGPAGVGWKGERHERL